MPTALDLLENMQSFDLTQAAADALMQNEQEVLDINREQLYDEGIGYDGKKLPPYSPIYAKRKPTRGVVDIYRTGKLHRGMKIIITGSDYTVASDVSYSPYVELARDKIFGFTPDGIEKATEIVQPSIVEAFKEHTGLM